MASRKQATMDDDVLAEIAAAETAAAKARERATAARARAQELRRLAEQPVEPEPTDIDVDDPSDLTVPRQGVRGRLGWKGLVIAAALLVTVGSVALTTIMVLAHRQDVRDQLLASQYVDAAEQAATALMGIDFTTAQDDMQQILDVTTGDLRNNYQSEAETIVSNMESTKVVTQVAITDSAVESMDSNMAVVLLAVRTQRTAADAPPDPNQVPMLWRLALTLVHEGGQIKVSNLEYL